MGSLVDWETEQLRLSEGLAEEFRAAEILEEDGYRTCIVGDLASVVYGADVVVSDLYIAVADNELQSALKTLLECDYLEEPQTQLQYMGSTAKESNPGWPGYRLRSQPRRRDSVGVLLMPATFWNLDLNRRSFWSDTLLFPQSKYRFPRLEAYMNALIRTFVERKSDKELNHGLTLYIHYQCAKVLTLLPEPRRSQLPIENQFFIQFFWKMRLPRSKMKFFSLWRMIRDGSLSIDEAITLLPQRDMRVAGMKQKS